MLTLGEVKELQARLNAQVGESLVVDGQLGPRTRDALERWATEWNKLIRGRLIEGPQADARALALLRYLGVG